MKIFRFFALLIVLFAFVSIVQATEITIQSTTVSGWRHSNTSPRLRIYLSKPFVTSTGTTVTQSGSPQSGGIFYTEYTCSVAANVLTIPAVTLHSTIDALTNNDAKYSAYFYTAAGAQIQPYQGFTSFALPANTPTTWATVMQFNSAGVPYRPTDTFTKPQILALLSQSGNSIATFLLKTPDATLSNSFAFSSLATGLLKNQTGTGNLSIAVADTDYLTPAGNGSSLTNLNASNLASGTLPDARFPITLPAVSGVNLTNLNASNLASGTVPDDRLSANVSLLGSSIDLSGAEATGTLAAGRFPALTGDVTTTAGSLSTTLATTIPNVHTFSGVMTHIQAPVGDGAQGNTANASMFRGADSSSGTPLSSNDPSVYLQTFRTGGSAGTGIFGYNFNYNTTGVLAGNTYGIYLMTRLDHSLSDTNDRFHEGIRSYMRASVTSLGSNNVVAYAFTANAERTVTGLRTVGYYVDQRNSTSSDAAVSTGSIDTTYAIVTSHDGISHNTGEWYMEGPSNATASYFGIKAAANALAQRAIDLTDASFTLQGTWAANVATSTLTGSGGHADVEVVAGDWLLVNSVYCQVASATANSITLTGT
jgi:hypothetical protein